MSMLDQHIPARESRHSSESKTVAGQQQEGNTTYRPSTPLSDTPRSVIRPQDSDDDTYHHDAMLNEYYDDMMGRNPKQPHAHDSKPEAAPALPARSNLRASRLLDAFDMKTNPAETTTLSRATPQEVYLSSEEDPSSSADEFSDYDFESDIEDVEKSPVRRKSHEDTATLISVVFVGKPSIIDLPASRRSSSPSSLGEQRPTRINTSATEPTLRRRLSVSSTSTTVSSQTAPYPLRSSATLSTLLSKKKPAFLSIDPYASKSYQESEEAENGQVTPRTPTALLKRGMSMIRKRSKPYLREGVNDSRDSLATPAPSVNLEQTQSPKKVEPPAPVTYNDIVKTAKKVARDSLSLAPESPAAQSPATPNGRNRILSSFHRRRSIKA
jgi:hypothetical protein